MKTKTTSKLIIRTLAVGAGCLILWSWYQGRRSDQAVKAPQILQAIQTPKTDNTRLSEPTKVMKPKVRHVVIQPAGAVMVPASAPTAPDAVKNFRNWAESYFAAEPGARQSLIKKGKELAELHRAEIKKTIPNDPKLALELAVPMVVRQDLPDEIEQLLESRVNESGKLLVLGAVSAENSEKVDPVRHLFQPETAGSGSFYKAHVYGDRAKMRSRNATRVNGIAVGGDLAISDSAVRQLEVGERLDPDKPTVEVCPISGKTTPVEKTANNQPAPVAAKAAVVEDNRKVYILCASGHIGLFASQLAQQESDGHWGAKTLAEGGTGGGATPFDVPPGWTTGTKKLLYLRVAFPDIMRDPQTEAACYENLRKATEYYMTNSYGQFYLTPTVAPLVVLPYPQSWYNASRDAIDNDPNGEFVLRDHALEIAARMGYDPSAYDLDVVEYIGGPGNFSGLGYVGGRGVWLKTDPGKPSSVAVLTHELGHNLGLYHANYWVTEPVSVTGPGKNQEYGNKFDVMGSTGGTTMGPMVAVHKAVLGWLSPGAVHRVTANGVYRIYQGDQDRADADKRYAIAVNMDSERDYWFEFRQTHTTLPNFMNGLMVNWSSWGSGFRNDQVFGSNGGAHLLDMTPGSRPGSSFAGADSRDDAGLVIGQTYSDPSVDVHVTPIFKSKIVNQTDIPYMDVVVNRGPFPGNLKPSLRIQATTLNAIVGVPISFSATGVDGQGDTLAYSWEFGDKTVSTDNSRLQEKFWALPGRYVVQCTVSDMKGLRTIKSILVTIQKPVEEPLGPIASGTIRDGNNQPVEGVYVSNFPLENADPVTPTSQVGPADFHYTYSDEDGNYTLTNLPTDQPQSISAARYPQSYVPTGIVFYTPTQDNDVTGLNWTQSGLIRNATVTVTNPTIAEGGTGIITLTRTDTAGVLNVQVMLGSQGTANKAVPADYLLDWRVPATPPTNPYLPIGQVLNLNNRSELRGCQGVSFANGQGTIEVRVRALTDGLQEGTENAVIDFPDTVYAYPNNAGLRTTPYHLSGARTAVIAITDNNTILPQVKLNVDDSSLSESKDQGIVRLTRDGSVTAPLTVNLLYTGIAQNGIAFVAPISVNIPVGKSEVKYSISAVDDLIAEGTETFTVALASSASYVNNSRLNQAVFYLLDNDQPVIQVTAPVPSTGEGSPAAGKFLITRSAVDIGEDQIVRFSLGGSALSGSDYRRVDGVAVIPANELSVDVPILSIEDSIDEQNQTVILRLATDPEYAIGVANEATVTIVDDDLTQFSINTDTNPVIEPSSGSAPQQMFRVSRTTQKGAFKVRYQISNSEKTTATEGTDYDSPYVQLPTAQSYGEVEFLETDLSKAISIGIRADTIAEPTEKLTIQLIGFAGDFTTPGYRVGFDSEATALILDGDSPGVIVSFAEQTGSLDNISENPARRIRFHFWRPGAGLAISNALDVKYSVLDGVELGTDYTLAAGQTFGTITIPPTQSSAYLNLDTINDTIPRGTRTLTVKIDQDNAYGIRIGEATIKIDDDDAYVGPTIGFSTATSTISEKNSLGEANVQNVTVTLSQPPASGNIAVEYRVIGGSATARGVDYSIVTPPTSDPLTPTSGVMQFTPSAVVGPVSKTFQIVTNPDTTPEGDETIILQLVNAVGANIGTDTLTITLADDALPEVLTDSIAGPAYQNANLRGRVIASNLPTTSWFLWGRSPSALVNRTVDQPVATGTGFVNMNQVLTQLEYPGTYYYRAVASNAKGTSMGIVRTIRTQAPPTVTTSLDAGHTASTVTMAGIINPNRGIVDYYFEWDTSPALTKTSGNGSLANGTKPVVVTATLEDLPEGSIVYYRLVAVSRAGLGTVSGAVQVSSAVPYLTAGNLIVNASANDSTAGTALWKNLGVTGGNFVPSTPTVLVPNVEETGIPGVFFDGKNVAYELPIPLSPTPPNVPSVDWLDVLGSSNRTIEVWALNPGYGTPDTLMSMGKDGVNTQVALNHSNLTQTDGALRHGTTLKTNAAFTDKNLPSLARWNHYAYVYEGDKKAASLYINGLKVVTVPALSLATTTDPVIIGASRSAGSVLGNYMQGYINSVRIHAGALKAADVMFNFRVGPARSPATAPIAVTTGVRGLTSTTATLNGTVASGGRPATAWIEWGTSSVYDNASAPIAVPVGTDPVAVVLAVPNLVAGLEYHYRVASRNSAGFSYGDDVVFTPQTLPSAGNLWVDLRAADFTGGSTWKNSGALGDFDKVGAPTISSDVMSTGYPGVQFNGSSTAFESSAAANLDFSYGSDQTLEVWALNPAVAGNETLVNQGRAITPASRLRLSYGPTFGVDDNSVAVQATDGWTTPPAAGVWTHFAVVVTGASRSLYINGVLSGTTLQAAGLNHWGDRVLLGAQRNAAGAIDFSEAFNGFINTVRIHGAAMLPAQVKASFDAGPTRDPGAPGLEPVVVTSAPSLISDVHATLAGTIQAGGLPTTYWFEWGTSALFGNLTQKISLPNTYSVNAVSGPIGGLPASTTIHYRLIAENAQSPMGGTVGATMTFMTASSALAGVPVARTNPATVTSIGRATLNGLATASTAAATAWFEYGPTGSMTLKSPNVTIPANATPRAMTFAAPALLPHTGYSFRLVVQNANGLVVGSTLTFNSLNSLPVVTPVVLKVIENVTTPIPLKGTDADKEPLIFNIVGAGITGTSPNFFYTSPGNVAGPVVFNYTATDGAATSTSTVTVTITPVNDAPVAIAASYSGPEATPITGTLAGEDEENDVISAYLLSKQPESGSVTVNATTGAFTYTPDAGFYGADSFEFRVVAGGQTSAPGVISLNLTVPSPTALATNVFTALNTTLNGRVLSKGTINSTAGYTIDTQPAPAAGVITAFDVDAGTFTFVPTTGYVGTASFNFTVTGGAVTSIPATVTIVVGGPVANSRDFSSVEDDVLAGTLTASGPNAPNFTFSAIIGAKNGTVLLNSNGTFTYNPKAGFIGVDRFEFKVNNGTLDSNPGIVTITVTKRPPNWVWTQGPNVANVPGIYGTLDTAAFTNTIGARGDAVSWADPNGTLWVFGGQGLAEGKVIGVLGDLWKRDPITLEWTWVSGSKALNSRANYGAQGEGAPTNQPGARSGAVSWRGQDGLLWMFGGNGFDAASAKIGALNDLWSYDTVQKEWTWWKGASVVNANGTYGVKGAPASTNTPGSRQGATAWVDGENTLWMFGGLGLPGIGAAPGPLNDLWKYIPDDNTWTWVSGDSGISTVGVYGELNGISSVAVPGARSYATGWTDENGLLYLFGGNGLGAAPRTIGFLSDVWVYYPESNRWSWVKGSPALGSTTVSALLGVSNVLNNPSGRAGATAWSTGSQEAWVFGGQARSGQTNDLWRMDLTTKTWTQLKNTTPTAVYGTRLVGEPSNTPGSRRGSASYAEFTGDLKLLGGVNAANNFSDLWTLDLLDTVGVQTVAANNITDTTATLAAIITPNKAGGKAGFKYWPLGKSANFTENLSSVLGTQGSQPISMPLSSLQPGTQYAYQAVALVSDKKTYGNVRVFETTGASPAISVKFATATATVTEGTDANFFVAVELSAPSTQLVTVPISAVLPGPLTLSGVAISGQDYGALPLVASFPPGQTSFWVRIPIINDALDETLDLLTLNLGTPSGGVSLGSQPSFILTMLDDDIQPRIAAVDQPISQFVRVGQEVTVTTTSSGSALKYQWQMNDKNIANATSSAYKFTATLASAANYTCVVTNNLGSTKSLPAQIFVLDSKPVLQIIEKGDAVMSIAAASPPGTGLDYKWRFSDAAANSLIDESQRVIGTQTPSMTLKSVRPTDSRGYICRVLRRGQPSFFLDAFLQELSVPDQAPTIPGGSNFTLPTGVVGVPYSYQVLVDYDLRKLASKYSATGLPKGLTINAKTGLITGRPTTAGSANVSITVSNVFNTIDIGTGIPLAQLNSTTKAAIPITILGLPGGVLGTYVGLIDRAPATSNMGGRVDLAITSAGTYTLKLNLSGFTASASGPVIPTISGASVPSVQGTAVIKRKVGQSNLSVSFTVTAAGVMTATLTDLQTPPLTAACPSGVRLGYSAASNAPNLGDYTVLFDLNSTEEGILKIPQGNGFLTMTLAKDGKITGAGRTADGNAFTLATILGQNGNWPIFASFSPIFGTLMGTPTTDTTGFVTGNVSWNKVAAPAPVKALLYYEGFSPIEMKVSGGLYTPPDDGTVVRGLNNAPNKARLGFGEGGLLLSELDTLVFSITNPTPLTKKQVITMPTPNPNKLTFILPAKPAGSFNGKVDILNGRKELVRNLTYQGVIAKTSATTWEAGGFVLVPQLPQPGQTVKTSTILSGQVRLEPNP
jgi:Bacterial Ig domain/Concanavalin A-like lectin/glucanases superfamily/PKD domain/Putative Ig domain/Galactose oxidase, central domain/Calx-beta domain